MSHRTSIFSLILAGFSLSAAPPIQTQEPLVVIVNRNNPVENISQDDLRKYCTASRKHWGDNKRVTIVLRDPGQAERAAVLQLVYNMNEGDFARHFLQGEFTGEVQSAPKHLSSGAGVKRFVVNVPGAIGFVHPSDADSTVKIIRVDGLAPNDPKYPLRMGGGR